MNNWVLHVENLGKIRKADIEMSPFMMFIGDNNSGKSYLMTLIYGLLDVSFQFSKFKIDSRTKAYHRVCTWLESRIEAATHDGNTTIIDEEIYQQINILLNEILRDNKEKFIRQYFNNNMKIGNISVDCPYQEMRIQVSKVLLDSQNEHITLTLKSREKAEKNASGIMFDISEMPFDFCISYLTLGILRAGYTQFAANKIAYLPASRTGFVLTYKTLSENSMAQKFNMGEMNKNFLTKPSSDFLGRLSTISTQHEVKKYQNIVNFVESNIVNGHIQVKNVGATDLAYVPNGNEQEIPMYLTSGVVTEMTPLLLFLKYVSMRTLIMEEPEMCLHPKLQWQLIRTLIKLVNAGMPVFITTHSDIILQHVNNMIKLQQFESKEDFMEKHDYQKDDMISSEKIRVYQFETKEDNSEVVPVLCGENGFVASTFIRTLQQMVWESGEMD